MIDNPDLCPSGEEIARMIPEGVQRRMIAHYYGTVSLCDDRIGRIIRALEEKGLWDSTIVIFASDHGDHLGEHYLWLKGVTSYESLVRVPFVVRLPEGQAAGRRCHELVSLFDLAPTFLRWADAEQPYTPEGHDFRERLDGCRFETLLAEPEKPIHEELFIGTRTVVTREWKYVHNGGDMDELYNLAEDPAEQVNLSGRPAHAEVEQELRGRLFERFDIEPR